MADSDFDVGLDLEEEEAAAAFDVFCFLVGGMAMVKIDSFRRRIRREVLWYAERVARFISPLVLAVVRRRSVPHTGPHKPGKRMFLSLARRLPRSKSELERHMLMSHHQVNSIIVPASGPFVQKAISHNDSCAVEPKKLQ